MWPFNLKEKVIKAAFSKYLDNEVIEAALSDTDKLQNKPIDYILLMVKTHEEIGKAIDIISKQDVSIDSITGTFITALIGAPLRKSNSKEIRLNVVAELSRELGANAVILHGGCDCLIGTVGNSHRMSYTAIIPEFKIKLLRLSSGEFGELIEI